MGERVTNPGFVWDGGGWVLDPEGWEDDWDCVMDPWHTGGYAQWDAWYLNMGFSISQTVDLTGVENLHLEFSHITEQNSGDDTYFKVMIDSDLLYEGPIYEGEETYVNEDFPISYSGLHTIKFLGHGGVNSYVGCYLWQCSAIGPDVPPAPVAAFTGSPLTGEAPLSVSFTDTSTGSPTSWLWSFGDGKLSAEQNPVHVYETPGSYDVNLKASNEGGFDTEQKDGYIVVNVPPKRAALLWAYQFGPS